MKPIKHNPDYPAITAAEAGPLKLTPKHVANPADNQILWEKFGIRTSDLEPQIYPDAVVTIVDMPCGSGKSTKMIEDLANAGNQPQLIVVPLLSEVLRVIDKSPVQIMQPISKSFVSSNKKAAAEYMLQEYPNTQSEGLWGRLTHVHTGVPAANKREALKGLIEAGHHIVTTHALFSELGWLAADGLLQNYDVQIDEVLAVADVATPITKMSKTAGECASANTKNGWRELYVGNDYVGIDPTTGKLSATDKWRDRADSLAGNLPKAMLIAMEAGRLYAEQDGLSPDIIMAELPAPLLKRCRSLKVYTYLAGGSFMAAYLKKHEITFTVESDAKLDAEFRAKAARLITVNVCHRLAKQTFSYTEQNKIARRRKPGASDRVVAQALARMIGTEGELKGVSKDKIMITSAKDTWFKPGSNDEQPGEFSRRSRLFEGAKWVPSKTRGTNDYAQCSHLVYLFNQNANPNVARFLGVDDQEHKDLYAVSELIQWIYRSRVRNDQPITLFLPSQRMRKLLADWMDGKL